MKKVRCPGCHKGKLEFVENITLIHNIYNNKGLDHIDEKTGEHYTCNKCGDNFIKDYELSGEPFYAPMLPSLQNSAEK